MSWDNYDDDSPLPGFTDGPSLWKDPETGEIKGYRVIAIDAPPRRPMPTPDSDHWSPNAVLQPERDALAENQGRTGKAVVDGMIESDDIDGVAYERAEADVDSALRPWWKPRGVPGVIAGPQRIGGQYLLSLDEEIENADGETSSRYDLIADPNARDPLAILIEEEERQEEAERLTDIVSAQERLAANGRPSTAFEERVAAAMMREMLDALRGSECSEPGCHVVLTPATFSNAVAGMFWFETRMGRPRAYCDAHNTNAAAIRRSRLLKEKSDPLA